MNAGQLLGPGLRLLAQARDGGRVIAFNLLEPGAVVELVRQQGVRRLFIHLLGAGAARVQGFPHRLFPFLGEALAGRAKILLDPFLFLLVLLFGLGEGTVMQLARPGEVAGNGVGGRCRRAFAQLMNHEQDHPERPPGPCPVSHKQESNPG